MYEGAVGSVSMTTAPIPTSKIKHTETRTLTIDQRWVTEILNLKTCISRVPNTGLICNHMHAKPIRIHRDTLVNTS